MIIVPPALAERPLAHYVAQPRSVTMASFGEAFACRVEVLWGDPATEPDPSLWDTEAAIVAASK